MTAGDLPVTAIPTKGSKATLVGYNLYDSLVLWDLSGAGEKQPTSTGPCTGVACRRKRQKRWIFTCAGCEVA